MHVLFVCTEGMHRSPTAAQVFEELAKKKKIKAEVKYAGIDNASRKPVSKVLLAWADKIYVMEDFQKDWIIDMNPAAGSKITVLGIADVYMKGEPGLVEILKEKLKKEI